ncbi:2-phospho-L-lactate guanylyltransferase [Cellulomonas sp. S1-8]|uniref:2-phospho-L-lactate guanylyltransferase n=1 Tax=Cellulomonas sp. S1-8 TaxID=2904790 RepID=UPI00224308D2|nr:2-phospho-L-lactate guanylyltransferase [Cellulomonas sp. S1-8]UZN04787.1 2-phospho-L-lactate guanylyltransferase [Cellulomonas sp. S1-8]
MSGWWAVVPVKEARRGKSRLAPALDDDTRAHLVRQMAAATVHALLTADRVDHVVLVTPDRALAALLRGPRTTVVDEPTGGPDAQVRGLDAAVLAGAAHVRTVAPRAPVVVVLGDLPFLVAREVDTVLEAAGALPRAHVPDAAGTGTTMLTATAPHALRPAFGRGSSARHAAAGHVRLDVPATSGARQDVDVPGDLVAMPPALLGTTTRRG